MNLDTLPTVDTRVCPHCDHLISVHLEKPPVHPEHRDGHRTCTRPFCTCEIIVTEDAA